MFAAYKKCSRPTFAPEKMFAAYEKWSQKGKNQKSKLRENN
jgi:hypothetical protein